MAVTNISPGNGVIDLGTNANPWTSGHFTNLYKGGVAVPVTTDARFPTEDEKAALAGSSGTPSVSNKFMTAEDRARVWFLEGVTGLTGGGATNLDGYSTTGVTVGLVVMIIDATATPVARTYELVSGTDAESSPAVIRPDDYSGGNQKVWKLRNSDTAADAMTVAFNPDNYTETAATIAGHLEGIDNKLATVLTTRVGVYRELSKSGFEFVPKTGTPTIGAVSNIGQCATFPDAASRSVLVAFRLPDEWDTATALKFKLEWAAAATGNAMFEVKGRLYDDAADLTAALGTAHTFTDANGAANAFQLTSGFSPPLSGTGRYCVLDIQRTGADASDTIAGNVYLMGVRCQYKEVTTEPAVW